MRLGQWSHFKCGTSRFPLMNRKNDRLDSVCLRGWGYYGDSLDLKLWRTTDVSLNKEAYAYAYNRHSFEPLRKHF
ncbi:unnamed protein product [Caenorhabditis nigoni]